MFRFISQLPYTLTLKSSTLNIFFTLFLGLIAAYFIDTATQNLQFYSYTL
ncbi:MAG TPA: hypothetical protein DCL31_12510 [Clostridium sp.]|nr:hypothetical protein [Clostridium sp.]